MDPSSRYSRRKFGRGLASIAGAGLVGATALPRIARAVESERAGFFPVNALPFHLQHEFDHATSCNNVIARAEEIVIAGEKQHAIQQRPATFGWGTITFFLEFDPGLVDQDMTFSTNVGWKGEATGEVVFSVAINGDIVIDGGRSTKDTWAEVERTLPVRSGEMRVTLLLDSIRGDNDFSFWWGEPQLRV